MMLGFSFDDTSAAGIPHRIAINRYLNDFISLTRSGLLLVKMSNGPQSGIQCCRCQSTSLIACRTVWPLGDVRSSFSLLSRSIIVTSNVAIFDHSNVLLSALLKSSLRTRSSCGPSPLMFFANEKSPRLSGLFRKRLLTPSRNASLLPCGSIVSESFLSLLRSRSGLWNL